MQQNIKSESVSHQSVYQKSFCNRNKDTEHKDIISSEAESQNNLQHKEQKYLIIKKGILIFFIMNLI